MKSKVEKIHLQSNLLRFIGVYVLLYDMCLLFNGFTTKIRIWRNDLHLIDQIMGEILTFVIPLLLTFLIIYPNKPKRSLEYTLTDYKEAIKLSKTLLLFPVITIFTPILMWFVFDLIFDIKDIHIIHPIILVVTIEAIMVVLYVLWKHKRFLNNIQLKFLPHDRIKYAELEIVLATAMIYLTFAFV